VDPAALFTAVGEHVAQRTPEAERSITNGQDRCTHAAPLEIAQQLGPRFGRLPIAVTNGDELLAPIGTHSDQHQATQAILLKADVEVDAISPQVNVVDVAEIALLVRGPFGTPLARQALDRRRAQSGLASEKLGQCRLEVLGGDAAQVQHR
jgi:hypothetical protein